MIPTKIATAIPGMPIFFKDVFMTLILRDNRPELRQEIIRYRRK
jgi:hypothetical protein